MRPAQDDRTATVHWRRRDPSAIEVLSSAACGLGRETCFAWKTFFRHCDAGKRLIIAKPYQRYGRDDNQGLSSTLNGQWRYPKTVIRQMSATTHLAMLKTRT